MEPPELGQLANPGPGPFCMPTASGLLTILLTANCWRQVVQMDAHAFGTRNLASRSANPFHFQGKSWPSPSILRRLLCSRVVGISCSLIHCQPFQRKGLY